MAETIKNIEVPDWFKVGLEFSSKWINKGDNLCQVLEFNAVENSVTVTIKTMFIPFDGGITRVSTVTDKHWNLEHTIWGFERGDYKSTN